MGVGIRVCCRAGCVKWTLVLGLRPWSLVFGLWFLESGIDFSLCLVAQHRLKSMPLLFGFWSLYLLYLYLESGI